MAQFGIHQYKSVSEMIPDAKHPRLPHFPRRQVNQIIAVRPAEQALLAAHLLPIALTSEDVHLLPGLQAPDDVIVFDGRRAAHVEPVDVADDAGRVVGEISDCLGCGVLCGHHPYGVKQKREKYQA